MTASERLKALKAKQHQHYWPGPPVEIIFGALPELIAVVQCAESELGLHPHHVGLHDCLAALNRVLEGGGTE